MPASAAQIEANRRNAAKSTGPKTSEGKEQSRQNALKHGLTGDGVVVPAEDAAEVERRFEAFRAELQPTGSIGLTLVKRAATLAVRMEKCAEREMTTTAERMARARAEFEVPEGVDEAQAALLRAEAGRIAAFDPSKEASLARRYEAAAERGFFRALKEFRLVEKRPIVADPAAEAKSLQAALGSFFPTKKPNAQSNHADPKSRLPRPQNPVDQVLHERMTRPAARVDVPFTIGRAR